MKLLLFTCARSYSVDRQTNAVSVFNVVERLAAREFPCSLPDLHVISVLKRDRLGTNLPLRLSVTIEGHTLLDEPFEVTFSDDGTARTFGRVGDLSVPVPGEVAFTFWRGNEKLGEWNIEMVEVPKTLQRSPIHEHEERAPHQFLN